MAGAQQQLSLSWGAALHPVLGHDVSLDVHLSSNGVLDPCCCLRHVVVELGIAGDEVLAQLGDAVGVDASGEAAEDHLVAVQAPIGAPRHRWVRSFLGVGDHH